MAFVNNGLGTGAANIRRLISDNYGFGRTQRRRRKPPSIRDIPFEKGSGRLSLRQSRFRFCVDRRCRVKSYIKFKIKAYYFMEYVSWGILELKTEYGMRENYVKGD